MGVGTNVYQWTYFGAILVFVLAMLPEQLKGNVGLNTDMLYQSSVVLFLWSISVAVAAVASKGQNGTIRLLPFNF